MHIARLNCTCEPSQLTLHLTAHKLELTGLFALPGVPGPPGQPQVRHLSSKCLTLDWAAPEYDGGAKVTKYLVEYFRVSTSVGSLDEVGDSFS